VAGLAVGIGLTSILWFDRIIASTQARFSMRFAAIGLTPELGSQWLLPQIIGLQNAKEMMLTGRTYGAEDGLRMALSHYVVPKGEGLAKGIELAKRVAQNAALTNFAIVQALPRIAEAEPVRQAVVS